MLHIERKRLFIFHGDFFGILASALCSVHCMLSPFYWSLSAISGIYWINNRWIDLGLFSFGMIVALRTLLPDYRCRHRKKKPGLLALAGFMALGTGILFPSWSAHSFLMISGGMLVAYSHVLNFRFKQGNYKPLIQLEGDYRRAKQLIILLFIGYLLTLGSTCEHPVQAPPDREKILNMVWRTR